MKMYECAASETHTSVLGPPYPPAPPLTVVTHLDFHSYKRRLIADAYARPGAANMLRPWRQPPPRVEAGGAGVLCVTPSPLPSAMSVILLGGTCRKELLHSPEEGISALVPLVVMLNHARAWSCAQVVVVVFSRSCRLAFHFLNLNGDWRRPLDLTKQIHRLPFRLLFSPFLTRGLLSAACSTGFLVGWQPLMESNASSST